VRFFAAQVQSGHQQHYFCRKTGMRIICICIIAFLKLFTAESQVKGGLPEPFKWGNTTFINLVKGETVAFDGTEIELLQVKNHYNKIRVDQDTNWLKVARRSNSFQSGPVRLYVADNRKVKSLSGTDGSHGLLTGDALIGIVQASSLFLPSEQFSFPVDFTDGYIWRGSEETYMFSYLQQNEGKSQPAENKGVGMELFNSRAARTNLITALENGTVTWIETVRCGTPRAAVCIQSESSPSVFYIYENLYDKSLMVKKNQKTERGVGIGYIWGEGSRELLRLVVVRSDTIPGYEDRYKNMINFYPQLLELYFGKNVLMPRIFSKGQIDFGKPGINRMDARNTFSYEEYEGTGWILGDWNPADKVEWATNRSNSNARLRKVLFEGQPAMCTNPLDYYLYEINVREGIYRIRASVGDCSLHSGQKVEFEGIPAGSYTLSPGEFVWTPEKIVRVKDGRLSVQIHMNAGTPVAGISKIVFQKAD
jgi:hypothetical protein